MALDAHEQIEKFQEFFEGEYEHNISENVLSGKKFLIVDFFDLSKFDHELAEELLESPDDTIKAAEIAIIQLDSDKNLRVRFRNLPESQKVFIRNLRSLHLDQFICIEGQIKQASDVRPKVVSAKFECPSCNNTITILQIDQKFREPTRCSCGRKGHFKLLEKDLIDAQRIVLEELPHTLDGGGQPRKLAVFLREDLVDPKMEKRTIPGSSVRINGVLGEIPVPTKDGGTSTTFDIVMNANFIEPVEEDFSDVVVNPEDVTVIKNLAKDKNIYNKLIRSIAPNIYGHEMIKEAVALQLFGATKKVNPDNTSTRGDMHILLCGDPGAGKSQILMYVKSNAPKVRYVAGKSASGVGLIGAVVKDEFLKGYALEAGAMVLAHKGMLAIDELDKMSDDDTAALHEALEQQCYLRDLELTFADGSKERIGDFVDKLMQQYKGRIIQGINCEILDIPPEIKILTTDFSSVFPTAITKVSRHIAPKNLVKIRLHNGKEITVTPEHPCWAINDGHITTVPASSLNESQFFPIPAELPIPGQEQTFDRKPWKNGPQLCKLIGYHITDGCYELNRGKKNGIQFANTNPDLVDDYKGAINSLFNINPGVTMRGNVASVRVVSKPVMEFMQYLDPNLMEKGLYKVIPDGIMKCRNEDIAFLLKALFDGDGTIVNVKRNGCRVGLVTENRKLADQVTELLLRFGIISSIYEDRAFFRVDICGQENLLKFYENIGFLSAKKQSRLKDYISKEKTFRSITDVVPNVSIAIKGIYNRLKLSDKKYFGHQIGVIGNKHRNVLQKLIAIAENRLGLLLETKILIESTADSVKLGLARRKIGLSALSISKKLGISDYILVQNEKKGKIDEKYQHVLIKKINDMISVVPELSELKKLAFGKIRWSRIKSVEIVENKDAEWVYDVTIEPSHSFISNNMVLHNSVSFAKANIQATLRCETSVLAAANPKFGRFDPYAPIASQIDLPPALINRFDLIFIVRDRPDKERDSKIAHQILQKSALHGVESEIKPELMRKYIAYAKQHVHPVLDKDALEEIKKFYVELRNSGQTGDEKVRPIPISARQLEAIVRLAEASARVRLSDKATVDDARRGIHLVKSTLMEIGIDPETGHLDIDRVGGSMPASERGKILSVREIIFKFDEEGKKAIPVNEIFAEAEKRGIKPDKVEEALEKLKRSGDIFQPKQGFMQKL